MMSGCSLAAFCFIIFASFKGMPISGTHTVIGALIGAGLAGTGLSGVGWSRLVKVILSWFFSPFFSMTVSAILFILVNLFTLGGYFTSIRYRIASLYLITALACTQMTFMLIKVVTRKNTNP